MKAKIEEEIKLFLKNRGEEKYLKRPSVHFLMSYANLILRIANDWQSKNYLSLESVISVRLDINIFKADVESDLSIGNDRKYRQVWDSKYEKLQYIKNKFLITLTE